MLEYDDMLKVLHLGVVVNETRKCNTFSMSSYSNILGNPEMLEYDDMLKVLHLGVVVNETRWLPVLFLSNSN